VRGAPKDVLVGAVVEEVGEVCFAAAELTDGEVAVGTGERAGEEIAHGRFVQLFARPYVDNLLRRMGHGGIGR
jgi:hypothetical protein